MAAASWAHISMYSASVAAIAALFCPKKLVAINVINNTRLAAITGGGTVIANAVSKAAAAARAWLAASSAAAPAALIQLTYGVTAAIIDREAGPSHGEPVSSSITEPYPDAPVVNSAASPSQAEAAAIIDPEPGPAYIRPELISGGNAPKSSTYEPLNSHDMGFLTRCLRLRPSPK